MDDVSFQSSDQNVQLGGAVSLGRSPSTAVMRTVARSFRETRRSTTRIDRDKETTLLLGADG